MLLIYTVQHCKLCRRCLAKPQKCFQTVVGVILFCQTKSNPLATLISSNKFCVLMNISKRQAAVWTVAAAGLTLWVDIFWSTFISAVCRWQRELQRFSKCAVVSAAPFSSHSVKWFSKQQQKSKAKWPHFPVHAGLWPWAFPPLHFEKEIPVQNTKWLVCLCFRLQTTDMILRCRARPLQRLG